MLCSPARAIPAPRTSFDFTQHMRRVCADMCARLPELRHVDVGRVAVAIRKARKRVSYGLQASLTPLRFEDGQLDKRISGRKWIIQRVFDAAAGASSGTEYLYILNFYLPRFLDQSLDEKLVTIIHELWHVGPRFDGDLRRHPGRCYMHSGSQENYDAWAAELSRKWIDHDPPGELYAFLKLSSRELLQRYTHIVGVRIPTPKLLRTD